MNLDYLSFSRFDNYIIIDIQTEKFDLYEASKLSKEIKKILSDEKYPNTIFDLTQVSYLDSAGIGLLVSTRNEIDKHAKKMAVVCNPKRDKIIQILHMAKIQEFFGIVTSVEDALRYIENPT